MSDKTIANRDITTLEPGFLSKVIPWLKECPQINVHEALRSDERQEYLISTGASQVARSNHQDGLAVDVHFREAPHFPDGADARWETVRETARKHGIISGWDLWKWDANHFQDDGVPHDKRGRYQKIMEEEVPEKDRVYKEFHNSDPLVETKALIEIALHRERQK